MTAHGGWHPELPLTTDRLLLRAHRADDLVDLLAFHTDPDVVRYTPWPVRDREQTAAALHRKLGQAQVDEPGQWLVLAVEERASATVIGEVLLKWADAASRQGEIGFAFAAPAQGRGLAAEAAREVLRLAFDDFGLHRVSALVVEGNTASTRLLDRLGFRPQGRLVDSVWFKGGWATQLLRAIDEHSWRAGAGPEQPADRDHTDDLAQLRHLVGLFFGVFTSGPDIAERMAALRGLFVPSAVIVRTCGLEPAVDDVEAFLAPRLTLLTDGSLTDFAEHATRGRFDVFGDVAQWFGAYTKGGRLRGEPYGGEGMKSMQFVRTTGGWRIAAAAWDDVRPGLTAADHLTVDG